MTDEPEIIQQNVEKTDKRGTSEGSKQTQFKPGFDKKRWVKGRGAKSPEQKEGEEILRAIIWEELSREFDTGSLKPLEQPETVDALRLMVRTWIKKRPEEIAQRIAGKVTDKVDLSNSDGTLKPEKEADETRAEILRKLASIATATGADKLLERPDTKTT